MHGVSSFSQRRKHRSARRGAAFWRDLFLVMTISLILHGLIFLIVSLIPPERPAYQDKSVTLVTDIEPAMEDIPMPEFDVEVPELDALSEVDLSDLETKIEEAPAEELVEVEEVETDEPNPDDGLDMLEDFSGDEGTGLEAMAALGMDFSKTLGDGLPSAYSGRTGKEKSKKTRQYGGTQKVLDAVDRSLAWLAAHQEADGHWRFMPGPIKEAAKAKNGNKVAPPKSKVKKEVDKNKGEEGANDGEKDPAAKEQHVKGVGASITASAILAF